MNLLNEPWLPFRLRDGSEQALPLSAITDPEVVDFALPRADFQGAAYQFAIGVLQTLFAPEDKYQWQDYYQQPPEKAELEQALTRAEHAFNADGAGPLFMQDYDELTEVKSGPVSGLLIDAPGGNGIKLNTDHFVKRGIGEQISLEMAVLALFTLQINAPSGGVGHRVGLRGGGPLTTLVLPAEEQASLWKKLWLNVINRQSWKYSEPDLTDGSVFPWLAPTQTSEKKGSEVYQDDVHPLHMYWAMPRRIRLEVLEREGQCQISGQSSKRLVCEYRSKNYGINYSGNWQHPLTPYKWDPKKPESERLSLKGQPGGIHYKIWDQLSFIASDDNQGQKCARVVSHFYELQRRGQSSVSRLWVFGYDMDNMKPRCWYSESLPLFQISLKEQSALLREVQRLQKLATNTLWHCRTQIKQAWFDNPKEAKGDTSFIDLAFWQRSQVAFFQAVQQLVANAAQDDAELSPEQAGDWLQALRNTALDLFDEYALSELGNQRTMAKRIKARHGLLGFLYPKDTKKNQKNDIRRFINDYQVEEEKEVIYDQ